LKVAESLEKIKTIKIEKEKSPINTGKRSWHCHETLWISELSSFTAVGVRQVHVVGLRLQDRVRRDDQIVAGKGTRLQVATRLGAFVEQHSVM